MPITQRAWFGFPGMIIGVGVAIAFFKLYGPLTRPAVRTPISATIDHFAPGVAINKSVKESSKRLGGLRWVQGVGFIGKPAGRARLRRIRRGASARVRSRAYARLGVRRIR